MQRAGVISFGRGAEIRLPPPPYAKTGEQFFERNKSRPVSAAKAPVNTVSRLPGISPLLELNHVRIHIGERCNDLVIQVPLGDVLDFSDVLVIECS